jgi:flagellin-specific chaperone FliS
MKNNNEKHIKRIRKELRVTLNEERKSELRRKLSELKKEIVEEKEMIELDS